MTQSNHSFVQALQDTFGQFWEARQERERTFLSVAALFALLALIYLIAVDPALTGREALRKSLPLLHQQSAQMQQMAQELASLPSAENRHEVTTELVEKALASHGLKALNLSVANGTVRAQFASTSMAALQGWLLELQKSCGLYVEEMKIIGLEGGQVSATLALRQPVPGN